MCIHTYLLFFTGVGDTYFVTDLCPATSVADPDPGSGVGYRIPNPSF
jgi:hypothetical protein